MDNRKNLTTSTRIDPGKITLASLSDPGHGDTRIETEVLAILLAWPRCRDEAFEQLTEECFSDGRTRAIFTACRDLWRRHAKFDQVTVLASLRQTAILSAPVESLYNELRQASYDVSFFAEYVEFLQDWADRRELLSAIQEAAMEGLDPMAERGGIVERLESRLHRIVVGASRDEVADHTAVVDEVGRLILSPPPDTCIPTGFVKLDSRIGGLRGGELTFVGGRPGSGKTGFALSLAHNIGVEFGIPTVLFELEMGQQQIWNREIGWLARIDHRRFENQHESMALTMEERQSVKDAVAQLKASKLYIDTRPYYTLPLLRARIRRMVDSAGIRVVMIDYAGKLKAEIHNRQRSDELSRITDALKGMAKEFNVPIVALHQLNRESENRTDHRPTMADFKGSGSFEEDADNVWLCYRPEYYRDELFENGESAVGKGDIMVEKFRNGEPGFCRLAFIKQHARWDNLSVLHEAPATYEPTHW